MVDDGGYALVVTRVVLLPNLQRPFIKRLCLGVLLAVVIEGGEVIEGLREVRVLRSEQRLSHVEGPQEEGFRSPANGKRRMVRTWVMEMYVTLGLHRSGPEGNLPPGHGTLLFYDKWQGDYILNGRQDEVVTKL